MLFVVQHGVDHSHLLALQHSSLVRFLPLAIRVEAAADEQCTDVTAANGMVELMSSLPHVVELEIAERRCIAWTRLLNCPLLTHLRRLIVGPGARGAWGVDDDDDLAAALLECRSLHTLQVDSLTLYADRPYSAALLESITQLPALTALQLEKAADKRVLRYINASAGTASRRHSPAAR